jgi:hypothetical protein
MATGMTALTGIMRGYRYDITGIDVLDAYAAVMLAARAMDVDEATAKENVRASITANGVCGMFVQRALAHQLAM